MTHIGKIGRLPKETRTQLGLRIEDGLPGAEIVKWLNGLPEVQYVLQDQFGGRPITEQNLSDWRQSGHPGWLRREEARLAAERLVEHASDIDQATTRRSLADRFAVALAAEMNRLATWLLEQEADPEKRWRRLCEINRELSQLRRDDHQAQRVALSKEQWQWKAEHEDLANEKRQKQAQKKKLTDMLMSPIQDKLMVQALGGGESASQLVELAHRIRFDLPLADPKLPPKKEAKTPEKSQKSSLIVPNKGATVPPAISPQASAPAHVATQ